MLQRAVSPMGLILALPLGLAGWIGYNALLHPPLQMTADTAAETPLSRVTEKPIACEKLPNVPGKSITTMLVDFPPGAVVPSHRHAGSVTAYVLRGVLRSQLNAEPVGTFGAGGTWFEPPGTLHTLVENPSATEPAQIMAIFVADSDCGALTIFEH